MGSIYRNTVERRWYRTQQTGKGTERNVERHEKRKEKDKRMQRKSQETERGKAGENKIRERAE